MDITMRILLLCLLGLTITACSSDSSSSGSATASPSGLAQAGLDISDAGADAPPVNGQLPDDLVPPAE